MKLSQWIEAGKKHVRAGSWEMGGCREGRKHASRPGGCVDEARKHRAAHAKPRGVAPHTLTVRPESPWPAQLTRRPVEAGVAFALSAG